MSDIPEQLDFKPIDQMAEIKKWHERNLANKNFYGYLYQDGSTSMNYSSQQPYMGHPHDTRRL